MNDELAQAIERQLEQLKKDKDQCSAQVMGAVLAAFSEAAYELSAFMVHDQFAADDRQEEQWATEHKAKHAKALETARRVQRGEVSFD